MNIKPYPLDWKILKILNRFHTANLEGIEGAVERNYSIHTIRKTIKKIENDRLIYSVRGDNKRKVYAFTEKGIEYIENMNINTNGLPEAKYNDIILKWNNSIEGDKIGLKGLPYGMNAIKVNNENEIFALVIKKDNEKLSEFITRLNKMVECKIKFKKIYVVTFNTNSEKGIPTEINDTKIELFKID